MRQVRTRRLPLRPGASLDPGVQAWHAALKGIDLVPFVKGLRGAERRAATRRPVAGHSSHGAGVARSLASSLFGLGGASRSATKASWRSDPSRNRTRSSKASSAACRVASSMNSERFLPKRRRRPVDQVPIAGADPQIDERFAGAFGCRLPLRHGAFLKEAGSGRNVKTIDRLFKADGLCCDRVSRRHLHLERLVPR